VPPNGPESPIVPLEEYGLSELSATHDVTPLQAVLRYRELLQVEQLFRQSKAVFDTRPIFHSRTPALVRNTNMPSKRASSASLPASISNARSPPHHTAFAQIAPVGGVADQCLLTPPQRILQSCDDRLTIAAILLGLRLVATDDVAATFDCYLLGK
jgi:hypothetical protein